MKIDCSITENYLKEKARMTNDCGIVCSKCELYMLCRTEGATDYAKIVEIVQQWSDANQQKTYLEDFKEKFPNFDGNDNEIIKNNSKYCVGLLYGKAPKMKDNNGHQYSCNGHCQKCWNQIMEEQQ